MTPTTTLMSKKEININNLEDLEREERRVIKRIRRQETELGQRFKQLPEEVVTTGIIKLVESLLEGAALTSLVNTVKKVGKSVVSSLLDKLKS